MDQCTPQTIFVTFCITVTYLKRTIFCSNLFVFFIYWSDVMQINEVQIIASVLCIFLEQLIMTAKFTTSHL